MKKQTTMSVDDYIEQFPLKTRAMLGQLRQAILKAANKAEEIISYKMPGYKFHGMVVWFAGYKNHIGFYPGASGIENFEEELAGYKTARGSVQFPLDKPLPLTLVRKITTFRVRQNVAKAGEKIKKKKAW